MERVKSFENLEVVGGVTYGCCELCGNWEALEEHHIFPGRGMRAISEKYGAKIRLCHYCHQTDRDSVHRSRETREAVQRYGQKKVMLEHGWSAGEFRAIFGKNYLSEEEAEEIEDMMEEREEAEGFFSLTDEDTDWMF